MTSPQQLDCRRACVLLYAYHRKSCTPRTRLSTVYHRNRVHPRKPMGWTHAWGPF